MASATPDLRLPPQPMAITNLYCLVNRGTLCVNNLPWVFTWSGEARTRTCDLSVASPTPYNHYATTPHIYGRWFKIQKFVPWFQRCGVSRMHFLDEQMSNGCAQTITHEFLSFLSDLHKIWLNIVEWSMLNANVLDLRHVNNIMYTSILATHIRTWWRGRTSTYTESKRFRKVMNAQCGLEKLKSAHLWWYPP